MLSSLLSEKRGSERDRGSPASGNSAETRIWVSLFQILKSYPQHQGSGGWLGLKRAGKEKQNIGQVPPPLSAAKPSREIGVPAMFLLLAVSVWMGGAERAQHRAIFPART